MEVLFEDEGKNCVEEKTQIKGYRKRSHCPSGRIDSLKIIASERNVNNDQNESVHEKAFQRDYKKSMIRD